MQHTFAPIVKDVAVTDEGAVTFELAHQFTYLSG